LLPSVIPIGGMHIKEKPDPLPKVVIITLWCYKSRNLTKAWNTFVVSYTLEKSSVSKHFSLPINHPNYPSPKKTIYISALGTWMSTN
jgi:hypothetical protein